MMLAHDNLLVGTQVEVRARTLHCCGQHADLSKRRQVGEHFRSALQTAASRSSLPQETAGLHAMLTRSEGLVQVITFTWPK